MHAEEYGELGEHGEFATAPGGRFQDSPGHAHDFAGHDTAPALDLGDEERLPWLESADDLEADEHGGGPRLLPLALLALLVLGLAVGAVYWLTHRSGSTRPADGSLIEASKDPYKVAPGDPGGKKFAGTGDSSFKVSQGEHPDASLAGSAGTTPPPATATPSAAPSAAPSAKPSSAPVAAPVNAAPARSTGGVAVQVGAYSSNAQAEAAWGRLSAGHDMLKGVPHRVVEGRADIGTVYRLQAMAGDGSAAVSLCSHLEADGVKCQVKR
jgi:hypothetical protein